MMAKPTEIILDVTRMTSGFTELISHWEMYVTVTGDLPDYVLMTNKQKNIYMGLCIKFFEKIRMELPQEFIKNPQFRGIPIICQKI
jgi:uncharacterized protein YpmS